MLLVIKGGNIFMQLSILPNMPEITFFFYHLKLWWKYLDVNLVMFR